MNREPLSILKSKKIDSTFAKDVIVNGKIVQQGKYQVHNETAKSAWQHSTEQPDYNC